MDENMSTGKVVTEIIDVRSDVVTTATDEMRKAMAVALVGDDVTGEDPTVNEFEKMAASMFGKASAIFLPSGTMGNLIAIMVHCSERGSEILLGHQSHIHIYEQGGIAQLAGIHHRTLRNISDGTFDLNELESNIVQDNDDHYALTKLICLEVTHNRCGGAVPPLEFLKRVKSVSDQRNIPIHIDGARLLNAAVSLNVLPSVITQYCDSVMVCLSKSLCAPVGSVLCGTKEFVNRARRYRKVLGGGMRQAGHLAAACIVALNTMVDRLKEDHFHALKFAHAISNLKSSRVNVNIHSVRTNIVLLNCNINELKPDEFSNKLLAPHLSKDGKLRVIKADPFGAESVRFVFHRHIHDGHVQIMADRIAAILSSPSSN